MPLTDTFLRAAKGAEKPYKKADGSGLFILVNPDGKRHWRMSYRYGGKQKTLSFGTYPLISLKEAREKRDTARKQLLDGIDPSEARKAQRAAEKAASEKTFEAVAREWHDWKKDSLTQRYVSMPEQNQATVPA